MSSHCKPTWRANLVAEYEAAKGVPADVMSTVNYIWKYTANGIMCYAITGPHWTRFRLLNATNGDYISNHAKTRVRLSTLLVHSDEWDWWQHDLCGKYGIYKLILCIHKVLYVGNNVYKPLRLVWAHCRDNSEWKSRVMKPTGLRHLGRMKPTGS